MFDASARELPEPEQFWGPGGKVIFNDPPQAAYVHVPFCRHRCGYCNFTLVAGRDDLVPRYLAALQRELAMLPVPAPVTTLYIGGGTPTQLDPHALDQLLEHVGRAFPLLPGGEWTVEANPSDVRPELAGLLERHGVTRVSLGVQSFQPTKLTVLERDHDARQARAACELLGDRFAGVGVDLIFGAPGETLDAWRADLAEVVALNVSHASTYGLTWEKGTRFWSRRQRGALAAVDEALDYDLYNEAIDRLEQAGFEHYEVSNFARPGARSRHNQVYWRGESYWGVGPGAASYVAGRRVLNHRSTTTYLRLIERGESAWESSEVLTARQRASELLVFSLRMREGVCLEEFARRTGWSVDEVGGEQLQRFTSAGWIEWTPSHCRLTRAGLMISDSLLGELVEE